MKWLKDHIWQILTAGLAGVVVVRNTNTEFAISDQMFQWIANNGFAVVVAMFLMYMLRVVILDASQHFTQRIDALADDQRMAFRDVTRSNAVLVETLEKQTQAINDNRVVMEQMHEGLKTMLLFLSHTQQEVVAHRATVEPQITGSAESSAATTTTPTKLGADI